MAISFTKANASMLFARSGVTAVPIYCSDFRCSHSVEMLADHWPNDVRLSDIESRFVCTACGRKGADVRPHPGWGKLRSVTDVR